MKRLVLAFVVAACGSSSPERTPEHTPVTIDKGVQLTYSLDLSLVADHAAAVKRAVDVTNGRFDRAKIRANAFARGETLVVEIGATDPEQMEQARELIGRRARLEVRVVAARSPFMDALHDYVASDSSAKTDDISAQDERWKTKDGAIHESYFITGPDRSPLERYLSSLGSRDRALNVPDGHILGYERYAGDGVRPRWRTYDLHAEVKLDNAAIKNAKAQGGEADRARVLVQLTDKGAQDLAALTRRTIGDKLAISIDGRVAAAPLIDEPITNGWFSIPADDAATLTIQLAAGAQPCAMRLETQAEIAGDKLRTMDQDGKIIMVPR